MFGNNCGCGDDSFIWIIFILILCCGCGGNKGGCGCDDGIIWIILLLVLCCGCGNNNNSLMGNTCCN
ncbi:MAG: chorion class high-cysteine HCB protein 13 [Christensenellaceae bacterium]|nr:chorion class high-cysteine HCB protein 13 [Christensenellaceae bacterium]MBS6565114.1 chorion class high-cysteine HCB protein 13 [Clostridiales bacterium]PWL96083.1 MAG: chorion class high-cysteine HCB protein 13 [Selenomonadales bacterium]